MNKSSKYSLEREHAPHVDPEWSSEFIIEARLQEVHGTAIGDALAEIDSHVVESGESPWDAFGDPKAYAATWARDAPKVADESVLGLIIPAVVQTLGMLAVLNALHPLLAGEPFELTVGQLCMLGLLVAAFALLAWKADAVIRGVLDRPIAAFAVSFVWLAALVGVLFIPGVVATLPAWWVVVLGAVVLVAGTVVEIARALRSGDDPIESPTSRPSRGGGRFAAIVPHLLIPVFTAVVAVVIILL